MSTNPFVKELVNRADERFSVDSSNMSMTDWICKNTTLQKKPFSVEGYEFQRQIADDMHPNLTCSKCSQVGLTEIQIRKALAFLSRNRGTSLIFTLPDDLMYERVSKTRVNPVLENDKVFNRWGKQPRSVDLKQLGDSYLYLVAASEKAATSIPADAVFNDELDLSDQATIGLFSSRMQNSKYKIHQRFSTPTWPEYGIDLEFKASDQHHYLARCKGCGHWNNPQFNRDFIHVPGISGEITDLTLVEESMQEKGLDIFGAYVKCERCSQRLELDDLDTREWVAERPGIKTMRGYQVSPFATEKLNPTYIFTQLFKYQMRQNLKGFFNTTLGKPYVSGANQLSKEVIEACMIGAGVPDIGKDKPVWVGIDLGATCHITLTTGYGGNDQKIFRMFAVPSEQLVVTVKDLLDQYNILGGIVDYMPYTPTAKEIRDLSGGRIMPVQYTGNAEFKEIRDPVTEKPDNYQVNRTLFLDMFVGKVRNKLIQIAGYGHNKELYISHLRDMVRDEPEEGQAKWIKLSGNDHYFHSSAYAFNAHRLKEAKDKFSKLDPRSIVYMLGVEQLNPGGERTLSGLPDKGIATNGLIGYS